MENGGVLDLDLGLGTEFFSQNGAKVDFFVDRKPRQ